MAGQVWRSPLPRDPPRSGSLWQRSEPRVFKMLRLDVLAILPSRVVGVLSVLRFGVDAGLMRGTALARQTSVPPAVVELPCFSDPNTRTRREPNPIAGWMPRTDSTTPDEAPPCFAFLVKNADMCLYLCYSFYIINQSICMCLCLPRLVDQ